VAEGTALLKRHTSQGYRGFESLRLRHPFSYNIVFIGVSTSTHMSTHNPPPLFGAEDRMNVFLSSDISEFKDFSRC
jgi:hypothetical protein